MQASGSVLARVGIFQAPFPVARLRCPVSRTGFTKRRLHLKPVPASLAVFPLTSTTENSFLRLLEMAFKPPKIPLKRRPSSPAGTPSVNSTATWPSAASARSSPIPHESSRPPKRASLESQSGRASSEAFVHLGRARRQSKRLVDTPLVLRDDVDGAAEDELPQERVMAIDMRDKGSVGCC